MAKPSLSTRVVRGDDGKFRWVYQMSLYRNPTIFLLVWKIFFFILLGIFVIMTLASLDDGTEGLLNSLRFFGYFLLGMTVLVGLGYLLYAAIMGGSYVVEFLMDENGVNHAQIDFQAKKAKGIANAALLAGVLSGRPSTIGAGISAQRTEMYSEFAHVKKVRCYPRRSLIKLDAPLCHNQVYVVPEDYAFVRDYILQHCPGIQ